MNWKPPWRAKIRRLPKGIRGFWRSPVRVTGHDLGERPDAWWSWWKDYNELLRPKQNPVRHTSYYNTEYHRSKTLRHRFKDCFEKGSPVWTQTGLRPIETIQVGDAVLAQDPDTGELAIKIVLDTSIRPASPMTSIRVGDETMTSTRGHRFWKEGQGWRMAKNPQAGAPVARRPTTAADRRGL